MTKLTDDVLERLSGWRSPVNLTDGIPFVRVILEPRMSGREVLGQRINGCVECGL